jgi:predicted phosphoribosyltransferase
MFVFRDRYDAGRRLALMFDAYIGDPDVVVLALPRGGVPVGYEVATRIGAPLDILVVRKIGVPDHAELAMGAIASGGIRIVDERIVKRLAITSEEFEEVEARERVELERRERELRGDRPAIDVEDKLVLVVDDGLATGSSMAAAIDAVRTRRPLRIIGAVPIAPPETCRELGNRADQMLCLFTPDPMYAVGLGYEDFTQTSDDEVRALLEAAERMNERSAPRIEPEPARRGDV